MYSLPIPFTDSVVELAPRWGDPVTFAGLAPWLLLAVVPVALVFWLYRYELHLVSRTTAGGLLSLRLLVVFILLFLVCLQPRLLPEFQEKATEHVLVLVDRTASMDVADPQREKVEKLKLARTLQVARDICTDLQLDEWIDQYQSKGAPQWVADDEYRDYPDKRRELEEQRRKQHDQVCQRIDEMTRSSIAHKLLATKGGDLTKKLGERFHVGLAGFAHEVWEPPADRLADLFQWPTSQRRSNEPEASATGKRTVTDASGSSSYRDFTDLKIPLNYALEQATQAKGQLRGIVLLTDGAHNRGDKPVELAEKLGSLKLGSRKTPVPIFPVAIGSAQVRPILLVREVEAPSVVLKDPEDAQTLNAQVKARLLVRGIKAEHIVVELKDKDRVLGRKRVALQPGIDEYDVTFPISLDKEGPQKLAVEIQSIPGLVDREGLRRPVEINVVKEQAEILMIDGEARWEFHYVSVALDRDPLVKEVRSVVFDQPRLGRVSEEDLRKRKYPTREMPAEPDALADYDCIILGDANERQLPLVERQRLAKYVKDVGGTLVIVAGKRSMPLVFPKVDPKTQEIDPLAAMLPIEEPRVVQSRNGFPVTLTEEGKENALLQLDDKPADDNVVPKPPAEGTTPSRTNVWAQLPPHYWAVVGRKKPAATTLAYYPGESDELVKDKKEAKEAQSLIAWHTYGKGRVLFVGLDSTWRWRYKVGDKHHHRFWGQLVRWATADKLLPGGAPPIRFGTPRTLYEPGQEIEVRVRMAKELDLLPKPPPDRPYQARILRVVDGKEEKAAVVPLASKDGQPRVLEGRVRDLPPGSYRVELDVAPLADKLQDSANPEAPKVTRSEFVVAAPPSEEMLDLTPDWALLENLAAKSGGKVFQPENAADLVKVLASAEEQVADRTPRALWEWWPTLVLILLLLTIEWVARKWAGLP
jgi:hypothetical protein